MKSKLKILFLSVVLTGMSIMSWNDIKQLGITSTEADAISSHIIFSPQLFNFCDITSQSQLEITRLIYLGAGLLSLVLLFSITSKFKQRFMTSFAVLIAGTSITWISSFQQISLLAFSIFSILLAQWAFAFVYPKAKSSGIIFYSVIAILSIFISPATDFLIGIHILLIIIKLISRSRITFSRPTQLIIIFIIFLPLWIWQSKDFSDYSIKTLVFLCPITIILETWILTFALKFILDFIYKFKAGLLRVTSLVFCYLIVAFLFLFWASSQYKTCYFKFTRTTDNNLLTGINFLNKTFETKDKLLVISENSIKENNRLKYYLPEFIENHNNISVSEITPEEWKSYHEILENFTNERVWITGAYLQKPDSSKKSRWKFSDFPFAMPIVLAEPTSKWNRINHHNLLREAIATAPNNVEINRKMLFWYINSPSSQLTHNLSKGYAQKDLSVNFILEKLHKDWHKAVIQTLYAWSDIGIKGYNLTNYSAYNNFISATTKAELDIERAVYIYRLYAIKMLENNMPEEAAKIAADSKLLEKENSFVERISAQIQQKINPDNLEKIEKLNAKAIKLHQERFSETFLEARYANAILKKKQAEYDDALKEILSLLKFVKSSNFIPSSVKTNNTKKGIELQNHWLQQKLEREGQFNAFIAEIHDDKENHKAAIEWYSKNTSEKFNRERNIIARRQISKIYEKNGELKNAYAQFKLLANNSTSVTEKIGFLIDAVQLYVNAGDSITVYEKWLELKDIIFKLPSKVKSRWLRNKKYKRITSHLQSRMQLDIRDQVMIDLTKKAVLTNSGWYLQQVGQLYRCKQQYDNAEKSFEKGMKKEIDYINNYLDGAMLQYKLLRFKKAQKIFKVFEQTINSSNLPGIYITDWRYQILKSFVENEKPPVASSLIEWSDKNKFRFSDQAKFHSFRGNIYASYNKFSPATNEFHKGISTNNFYLENYLDLGYQLCLKNDSKNVSILLDKIFNLNINTTIKNKINDDWRIIQLHFVAAAH